MSVTTTNMSLISWSAPGDYFNNSELDINWQKVDTHDHTSGKGVQIPAGGLAANAVAAAALAANSVTSAKIAADAVGTTQIASNAVTARGIGTLPATRVFNSANISHTTSGTAQSLTFDTERFDTDTMHDTATNTNRLTVKTPGIYLVTGTLEFAANATGYRQASIRLNGATVIASARDVTSSGTDTSRLVVTTLWKAALNDYFEFMCNQSSGGALNVLFTASISPEFSATWVGEG